EHQEVSPRGGAAVDRAGEGDVAPVLVVCPIAGPAVVLSGIDQLQRDGGAVGAGAPRNPSFVADLVDDNLWRAVGPGFEQSQRLSIGIEVAVELVEGRGIGISRGKGRAVLGQNKELSAADNRA